MTPEERQMLADLFERIRGQANLPRDGEAEAFIANAVRAQPYGPYLLAQTVLVQEQALSAAAQKLQDLQERVQSLESAAPSQTGGSFLGNLGKSIFGGSPAPSRGAVPGYAPQPNYAPPPNYAQPPSYAQQPSPGPWGQPQAAAPGGGFLKGALGAAAGVAGGVLLADGLRSMFAGHNSTFTQMAGIDTATAGQADGGMFPSDAAVDLRQQDILQDQDQDQDLEQDASGDADYSSSDDSSNV